MTELFTVTFTTKTAVTKIVQNGPRARKVATRVETETPVKLDRLTREKAMAYSGCDNFKMEPFDPAQHLTAKGTGRDSSVGNGTVMKGLVKTGMGVRPGEVSVVSAGAGKSVIAAAARTGNLGAAING